MGAAAVRGFLAGAFIGAVPFLLLGFRTTSWVPFATAMLMAGVLSAMTWRTPLALGLVVLAGTLVTFGAFVAYVGSDRRLLPYVIVSFSMYYLAGLAGFGVGAWRASRRSETAAK